MKKYFALFVMMTIAAVTDLSAAVRPDEPGDFHAVFEFAGDDSYVGLSLKAPTKGTDSGNYEKVDLTEITAITVLRSSYDADEYDVEVMTFLSPVPGETLTFQDRNAFVFGSDYTYTARCFIGDTQSWGANARIFAGVRPARPEMSVTTSDKGEGPVRITITVPSTDDAGKELASPLTEIMLVRAKEYGETIELKNFTSFEEGGQVTYIDRNVVTGEIYTYRVIAGTEFGKSEPASCSVYIGADTPACPTDIQAISDGNSGAFLSWNAPESGYNNGWIDPAATRYRVSRLTPGGETELASGLDVTSYHDLCADLDAETGAVWRVTAYNEAGGDASAVSGSEICVGPASGLPYYESFYGSTGYYGAPVNYWTTSSDSYWDYSNSINWSFYIEGVRCDDNTDDGYASTYFSSYSSAPKEDNLTSGRICLKNAVYPVVSFYTVPLVTGCRMTLEAVSPDGPVTSVGVIDLNDGAPAEGEDHVWRRYVFPMPGFAGAEEIRLRFSTHSAADVSGNTYIFLDEILLDDYPPVGLPVAAVDEEGVITVTWNDPSTDSRKVSDYTVIVNGEEADITTTPSYRMQGKDKGDYIFTVIAGYDGISSCPSEECAVRVGLATDGVETPEADTVGTVEYYNLQGIRISAPECGATVVRHVVSSDGTRKTEKIIIR